MLYEVITEIPTQVPDVPDDMLFPRDTWKDQSAYDAQALKLAGMFRENFKKFVITSYSIHYTKLYEALT